AYRQLRCTPHAARLLLSDEARRVEVVHLGADMRGEIRAVESGHRPDARLSREQSVPESVLPGSHRRNHTDAGDYNAPHAVAALLACDASHCCTIATDSSTLVALLYSSSGMSILNFLSTAIITSIAISESTPSSSM